MYNCNTTFHLFESQDKILNTVEYSILLCLVCKIHGIHVPYLYIIDIIFSFLTHLKTLIAVNYKIIAI